MRLVVVGNGRGQVGWGYGKANEVPPAVEKGRQGRPQANEAGPPPRRNDPARRHRPVRRGQGPADAGQPRYRRHRRGAVRAVVESAGVKDILTKSFGSNNKLNLVKAAIHALLQLRTKEEIARLRGVPL